MLEVKDLHKSFGPIQAVNGVSFSIKKGEVLGFLGPNGAGKSTTMRMITGFLAPTSGTAIIDGHDILSEPVAAKRKIGYLPESAPVYADMTATGFLKFAAEMRGFKRADIPAKVSETIERCRLEKVRNQPLGTLSKGYRQRVCFAQAIIHDPPLLIMDEPTDGLDPNQKHLVREMITSMAKDKAIIISTHILEEVDAICSRAIVIADGKIVADGTPAEVKGSHESLDLAFRDLTSGTEHTRKAG